MLPVTAQARGPLNIERLMDRDLTALNERKNTTSVPPQTLLALVQ